VEGDRSLVEEFITQMKIGPRSAHVSEVKINWLEKTGKDKDFQIRYTA